jgi:hypothetical protein
LPEEVVFIRSDQYSFVQQGIPAVMPEPAIKSSDPKIKPMDIFMNWLATRQHQPNDDMQQPGLDFEAAATFARYMFLCGFMISNDSQKPSWNKGDFLPSILHGVLNEQTQRVKTAQLTMRTARKDPLL